MNQTKKVNIYPKNAITTITPPIRTAVKNITKPISDIRKCLIARAYVEEVLPDGDLVVLDFTNYNLDNTKTVVAKPIEPVKETPIVEEPKIEQQEHNSPEEVEKPAVETIVGDSEVIEHVTENNTVVSEEPVNKDDKSEVAEQSIVEQPSSTPVVNQQPQQQNNNQKKYNNKKQNNNKGNNNIVKNNQ